MPILAGKVGFGKGPENPVFCRLFAGSGKPGFYQISGLSTTRQPPLCALFFSSDFMPKLFRFLVAKSCLTDHWIRHFVGVLFVRSKQGLGRV